MDNRILREIRYYELRPSGYKGDFNGSLGNIYKNSSDTKFIGQRIARKLNELGFVSGEFDHIYIHFSSELNENVIIKSDIYNDKRIESIKYGLNPLIFNNLNESEKDKTIKDITFEVLRWYYSNDYQSESLIKTVKSLLDKDDRQLNILFTKKETNSFIIELRYQIRPINDKSKLLIQYTDKKDKIDRISSLEIMDYEDLYSLIDKILVKDNVITFLPKKGHFNEFVQERYKDFPLRLDIDKMIKNNSH